MPERTVWATRLTSEQFSCACLLTVSEENAPESPEPDYPSPDARHLIEDRVYWYTLEVSDPTVRARLVPVSRLIKGSPRDRSEGVLNTQSQAGILRLEVELSRHDETDSLIANVDVYPAKFDVLAYRAMINDICRHSLSLALRLNAATSVPLHVSSRIDESGIAQRFFFIRHLLGDAAFRLALEQVANNPHTRIKREQSSQSLASARRLDGRSMRALVSGRDRVQVPPGHRLERLGSLPRNGVSLLPVETADTSENRFVRFALHEFSDALSTVSAVCSSSGKASDRRIADEATRLDAQLRATLEHPTFRDLGESSMLPLGSPVLHKRAGYREIFDVWLQFHIAASLNWEGSADVFGAGRRDTDKLYEYWLFFQMLDVVSAELGLALPRPEELISTSSDGFALQLRAGRNFVHEGTTSVGADPLIARFSYNRTFSTGSNESLAGSWSLTVRPDFTVSLWPTAIDAELAERLHLVVHLHFDAKYRLSESLQHSEDVGGSFRREDLFVAHTYRDAIRRSWGAFVIYPGEETATLHSVRPGAMPGVGAFPVKPTVDGEPNGIEAIGELIRGVAEHFGNALEPRERLRQIVWTSSERNREWPGGGLILVPDPECCFRLSLEGYEGSLALRLSGHRGEAILASEAWKICDSILIEGDSPSSLLLIRIGPGGWKPTEAKVLQPPGQQTLPELCVILRPDWEAALKVVPKSHSAMGDLRNFVSTYLGCCATPEVLEKFVQLG